ncbi:MAG: GNAT family N-acetyltransferase [Gammaproteobacteria bacterium]|nr:GNAT family N-acetyltransferase [Gammaproteobacteria bacterium]
MLSLQDHKINVYRAAISYLFEKGPEMDEIFFGAVSESERFDELNDPAWSVKLLESSPAWSLELGGLASGIDAYLSTLSKNRRGQIRRSFKLFERQGPLLLQVAKNVAEALDYFEGLKQLHTIRWNRDGKPGSFANLRWEAFHRSLISSRAPEGDIHLIKVSIGQEAIGFLYNLIWRDRVYVLQTGFRQYDDKRLMPGYVVHLLAIEHYVKLGLHVYDLMHGDSLYKRILCNRKERLNWYSVQRNRWKFVLEDSAVGLVRAVRGKFTT